MDNPLICDLEFFTEEEYAGWRAVVLPRSVIRYATSHTLLSRLFPTDIGYYARAKGHQRRRESGSEQTIFIYCVRGGGWFEMEDTRLQITPGDLLVIPPGIPHIYAADGEKPWTIYWFHLAGEDVSAFHEHLSIGTNRRIFHAGVEPQFSALFEEALTTLEGGYAPQQLLHSAQALRYALSLMVLKSGHVGTNSISAVENTVRFMERHLDKPLRVAQLAAMANLSSSHYAALFRERIGYAPMDYFIRLRLHRACQLLDTSDLSIAQVAARVGYDDPYYFSRLFKLVHEMTPSQYRKWRKG